VEGIEMAAWSLRTGEVTPAANDLQRMGEVGQLGEILKFGTQELNSQAFQNLTPTHEFFDFERFSSFFFIFSFFCFSFSMPRERTILPLTLEHVQQITHFSFQYQKLFFW
jgi:hypothetical protein